MKKITLLLAVGVLLALVLGACTAAPQAAAPGEPAAGEKVKVLFWDQFPDVSDQIGSDRGRLQRRAPRH